MEAINRVLVSYVILLVVAPLPLVYFIAKVYLAGAFGAGFWMYTGMSLVAAVPLVERHALFDALAGKRVRWKFETKAATYLVLLGALCLCISSVLQVVSRVSSAA